MFRVSVRSFSTSLVARVPTFKVAVVGSGPAGFYTAYHVLNKAPKEKFHVKLDFFERLPAPFGLSRYGVAPDHPEVKNCEEYLRNMMNLGDDIRFFGNIEIGKDATLQDLEKNYHSVVLAYGSVKIDNKLNIPGGDLPGVVSARQFVNWYNGHPDCYSTNTPYIPPALDQIENVTIIGNGNVAMDVARILLASPETHWAPTDISVEAFEVLKSSKVKNVNIVARRGLLESAFTNKEIRELLELNSTGKVKFIPVDDEVYAAIEPFTKKLDRANKRRMGLLEKYSKDTDYTPEKTWSLQYLKSPKEFVVNPKNPQLLSSTVFTKNKIEPEGDTFKIVRDVDAKPVILKNELVILSIGYKGSKLEGFEETGILFDESKNRIANRGGRVLSNSSDYKKGFYTSGWIKNGPKGVIASTMMDSFDTGYNILEDLSNSIHTDPTSTDLDNKLSDLKYVSWKDWIKLDEHEIKNGENANKARVKVCNPEKMIEIACK